MRAKIMKITYTDSRDGMVLIGFTDERGEHEIALSTIETADLIGALRTSLQEALEVRPQTAWAFPASSECRSLRLRKKYFSAFI